MSAVPARRPGLLAYAQTLLIVSPRDVAALRRGLEASKRIDVRLGRATRQEDVQRSHDRIADASDVMN